jgi:signal transduction histidine kinase
VNAAAEVPAAQIAAVLGHELRNPVASAVVSVALARELTDAADPRRPQLDRALADLRRAGDLIGACLALGAGRLPEVARVPLAPLLAEVAAAADRIEVGVELADRALALRGSAVLLRRCFENLVENAARAGARRVAIHAERDAEQIRLRIADDGPGIPAELRELLFTPFCSHSGGTGLGLAIVHDVIALHGGSIELAEAQHGACFRIRLPVEGA